MSARRASLFILLFGAWLCVCTSVTHATVEDPPGTFAEKLGPGYRVKHTQHFSLISNTNDDATDAQAAALEDAYTVFYREAAKIGLKPTEPPDRLVCVLFERYEEYRDYVQKYESTDAGWSSGHYSSKTNRVAFFHDRDSPAFAEIRKQIANIEKRIGELRSEMAVSTRTARRLEIQQQLKDLNAAATDMNSRLASAGKLATLGKTRHEATHQLLYNSGLFQRGKEYPFWLNEGLSCCFEEETTGPRSPNRYRLHTYQAAAKASKLMSLPDLIAHHPADDAIIERVAADYSQAWALVHFLWNKRPADLRNLMGTLDRPGNPVDQFRRSFGDDLTELDREIRAYIDGL